MNFFLIYSALINFTKDKSQPAILGYFYTVLIYVSALIQTVLFNHYAHRMFIVGSRVRTGLMGLIYKKCLRLSPSARKATTVGEMVNLMAGKYHYRLI
jgi:ATP-binding cassette, subfamily C (CFTR/MRP), member 1